MRRIAALALTCALTAMAFDAPAEVLFAPVGGRSVRIAPDRVLCAPAGGPRGWTVDGDGRGARPPTSDEAVGTSATFPVAADAAHCSSARATVTLVAVGPRPAVDPAQLTVDVDAGVATVRGRGLRGMVLRWASNAAAGVDTCTEPTTANGVESCTLSVGRALPADANAIELAPLPAGTPTSPDAQGFDAQGRAVPWSEFALRPARVLVTRLLPVDAAVDIQSGTARVALLHPEAIAQVDCAEAACDLEGSDLVVRDVRTAEASLEARVRLRPHVFLQRGASAADPSAMLTVPLQRCPVGIASAPPLAGVSDQRVVVRVGGRCARARDLAFTTALGGALVARSELVDDALYAVVRVPRTEGNELAVTVQRGATIVGVARARTRDAPSIRARLELPGHGDVSFIPTNREARVLLPAGAGEFVPTPLEGIYTVRRTPEGADLVRGVPGVAGSVSLRLAYRDPTLPPVLRDTELARISEPVERAVREANLAVPLNVAANSTRPLIELLCGTRNGRARRIEPGETASVPYGARDTCRLVLHREYLHTEDGVQALHVKIDAFASDGGAKQSAGIDQDVDLAPGASPRVMYIAGNAAPFDRLIVRVSVRPDDRHWAIPPDDRTGAPQAQWSLIMDDARFRIYGRFALPTGLFRVSDRAGTGNLLLNAGILFRLVPLTREGQEFPIGIDAGLMWLGISNPFNGDPRVAVLGGPALVAGIGVGLPIANPGRPSQASLTLHLWAEYEIYRDILGKPIGDTSGATPGQSFGIVFGPSISVGNLGSNF